MGPLEQAGQPPTNLKKHVINPGSACDFIAPKEPEIQQTQGDDLDADSWYEEDNASQDEIEDDSGPPVSPAIDRSDEMYATYYDRSLYSILYLP